MASTNYEPACCLSYTIRLLDEVIYAQPWPIMEDSLYSQLLYHTRYPFYPHRAGFVYQFDLLLERVTEWITATTMDNLRHFNFTLTPTKYITGKFSRRELHLPCSCYCSQPPLMTNSDRRALTSVSCVDMNIYFASRGLEENHKLEGEVHVVSDAEHNKVLLMALENLLKFVEEGHRLLLMGDVCDRANRELRDKIYNFDNVLLSCSARAVAIISEVLGSRELYLLLEKALFKASFSGSAYRLNSAVI